MIRRRIYISVPRGKKDTKYLIKKSFNQPVRMLRLKGGEGKKCFFPDKDLGTRVGD